MNFKYTAGAIFIFAVIFSVHFEVLAQTVSIPEQAASDVATRRAKLENDLKILESQIEAQRQIVGTKQKESTSLERDIAIFDAKISQANLSIRARNLTIQKLTTDIGDKQKTIGELGDKLERELKSLAHLIRVTDQIESISIAEFVMGNRTVSDLFSDIDHFTELGVALSKSRDAVATYKDDTEQEKKALEGRKTEEVELRAIQTLEKQRIEQNKKEKANILKVTRGQEAIYQEILTARQKDAAAIRSELFVLQGSKAISFEKAYEYALIAETKTGVRPAFLLGIITEETNLGENLGSGNWRTDMHPTRDQPVFSQITSELGFNPDTMPVSKKPWYGWGGAMGPAQFIPSTWILYKDKIASLTGHSPPNPWDPYDAFMASAILLKENGGAGGNYSKERLAALRYLAGWTNANKKAYAFYGDDVMELAEKYQNQIDILKRN